MENVIILKLSDAVEAKLDKIIELLTMGVDPVDRVPPVIEFPVKPQNEAEQPKAQAGESVNPTPETPATPDPVDEAKAEEPAVVYSEVDVSKKVVQLSAKGPGIKAKVREIVMAYALPGEDGKKRVGTIPEDKRAEVMYLLTELEV